MISQTIPILIDLKVQVRSIGTKYKLTLLYEQVILFNISFLKNNFDTAFNDSFVSQNNNIKFLVSFKIFSFISTPSKVQGQIIQYSNYCQNLPDINIYIMKVVVGYCLRLVDK